MKTNKLTVLTYNVWFDRRYAEPRLAGLKDMLTRLHPTIIALQEVTLEVFAALFESLSRLGYHCNYKSEKNFQPINGYGVCIFSQIPIVKAEIVPFHVTSMGRHFVRVLLENDIYVVTTHLESLNPNAAVRQKQLRQLMEHCRSNKPHIWTMDSNLTDVGEDHFPAGSAWSDLYDMVGRPASEKFTYDALKNDNVLTNYRSRLDRIYCSSARGENFWMCIGFQLEGLQKLKSTGSPVSDHFAVFARLQMKSEAK